MFAFTIKYFFTPVRKIGWHFILFLFVFSPMAFFLANFLMSDLLFLAVIYIFLAAFIFILKRKSWIALLIFLIALFCSLHIRYSAMVFPAVFIVSFLFLKGTRRFIFIAGILVVTVIFHSQIKRMMKETTQFDQFSTGFDGWQFANNALHVIPFIDSDTAEIADKNLQALHQFVVSYKDTILEKIKQGKIATSAFLWEVGCPLKLYLQQEIARLQRPYSQLWILLGSTTYRDYGQYLMLKYPWKFMRYYYLPNMRHVFFLYSPEIFNVENSIEWKEAFAWYKLDETQDLAAKHPYYKGSAWTLMQVLWVLGWICILVLSVWAVLWRKRLRYSAGDKLVFWSLFAFGAIYYASTVFASPIADRYWAPMGCMHFAFCYILLNKLVSAMKPAPLETNPIQQVVLKKASIPTQGKGKKQGIARKTKYDTKG
jgi:hypothetical protein